MLKSTLVCVMGMPGLFLQRNSTKRVRESETAGTKAAPHTPTSSESPYSKSYEGFFLFSPPVSRQRHQRLPLPNTPRSQQTRCAPSRPLPTSLGAPDQRQGRCEHLRRRRAWRTPPSKVAGAGWVRVWVQIWSIAKRDETRRGATLICKSL